MKKKNWGHNSGPTGLIYLQKLRQVFGYSSHKLSVLVWLECLLGVSPGAGVHTAALNLLCISSVFSQEYQNGGLCGMGECSHHFHFFLMCNTFENRVCWPWGSSVLFLLPSLHQQMFSLILYTNIKMIHFDQRVLQGCDFLQRNRKQPEAS